jgi:hypothetical protein
MIAVRQQRQAQLNVEIDRLQQQIDTLIARNPTHLPNKTLLAHLANEQQHLLTFLKTPGGQATNWRAEQAIRPAIVNRKNWGGNRTPPRSRYPADADERDPHQPPTAHLPDQTAHQPATPHHSVTQRHAPPPRRPG